MTTIIEFLEARIAEDEAVARAATPGPWAVQTAEEGTTTYWGIEDVVPIGINMEWSSWESTIDTAETAAHIARFDPARMLAECKAKRAILALHVCRCPDAGCTDCGECSGRHHADPEPFPCDTVKTLAQVYADHSDFDQAWSVSDV